MLRKRTTCSPAAWQSWECLRDRIGYYRYWKGTEDGSALRRECEGLLDTLYQSTFWQLSERLSEFRNERKVKTNE